MPKPLAYDQKTGKLLYNPETGKLCTTCCGSSNCSDTQVRPTITGVDERDSIFVPPDCEDCSPFNDTLLLPGSDVARLLLSGCKFLADPILSNYDYICGYQTTPTACAEIYTIEAMVVGKTNTGWLGMAGIHSPGNYSGEAGGNAEVIYTYNTFNPLDPADPVLPGTGQLLDFSYAFSEPTCTIADVEVCFFENIFIDMTVESIE